MYSVEEDTGIKDESFEHEAIFNMCISLCSQYSSWSDDIQQQYRAILVREVQKGRSMEVVQVLKDYTPTTLQEK